MTAAPTLRLHPLAVSLLLLGAATAVQAQSLAELY